MKKSKNKPRMKDLDIAGLRFIIYKSGIFRKSWKWKAVARNNRIVASGRGFNEKEYATDSVSMIIGYIQKKDIEVIIKD